MSKESKIKAGDIVSISYIGELENGEIFDTTDDKGIITIKIGERKILKAIEENLLGMKEGEEKEIILTPDKAFGTFKDYLQISVERNTVDKIKKDIKIGDPVVLTEKSGKEIKGIISKVNEESVIIDMNHPLAGRTVIYKVKIESIEA
jgi:peptidylprolyl isomerase